MTLDEHDATLPWLMSTVVEPVNRNDLAAFDEMLSEICSGFETCILARNAEAGETSVLYRDERHFEAFMQHLNARYAAPIAIGPPSVEFRETIRTGARIDHTHKQLREGTGEFARLVLSVRPIEPSHKSAFQITTAENKLPQSCLNSIELGFREALRAGPLAGFPVIGVSGELLDCAYHETDSSDAAFFAAAKVATRTALERAEGELLEPVMSIEVVVSGKQTGAVLADLEKRQAAILHVMESGENQHIVARACLRHLLGFEAGLNESEIRYRSLAMTFSGYEPANHRGDRGPDDFPGAIALRA